MAFLVLYFCEKKTIDSGTVKQIIDWLTSFTNSHKRTAPIDYSFTPYSFKVTTFKVVDTFSPQKNQQKVLSYFCETLTKTSVQNLETAFFLQLKDCSSSWPLLFVSKFITTWLNTLLHVYLIINIDSLSKERRHVGCYMETSVVIHKLLGLNVSVDVSHMIESNNVLIIKTLGSFYLRFR